MTDPCSIALLESALAGSLPKQEEASLHYHLEECEACSAAMEQMAGGPAWCQEAASLLAEDELDGIVPTREEWSDVDFTVEHLEPANEPNVLGRLGGYDVLDIIGRGGMGVVLKGFDRELKRSVAIKVLAPHLAQSSLARKRFAREAQAAAAVVHPHVLAIHQVQPGGRLPFLVMPLVAGESLAERLTAQGTLELKEILRIGMQAAAGLAAAHEQGLVHRDVKPANILLEKGVERAVLTDFGLACAADDVTLTRWGIIAGTPPYMSPEQAQGEPLDGRSDLFSLGCVLYEMATGVSPFRADSVMATMRRLIDDSPQAIVSLNPELPPWFVAIVDRLLEKDPSRRFNSAKEVSDLLEGCLAHVQQPASVPLPAGLPKPASHGGWRSNLGIKGVLTMIGVLGAGLLGVLLATANPPDIAGQWSGEDWGTVVLTKISDAEYSGTYSETVGKQTSLSVTGSGAGSSGSAGLSSGTTSSTAGEIRLIWSRIERRFNGTWREGDDRFGELSVRLVGDEIRGALTTDVKSKINPATPRLADLTWRRAAPNQYIGTLTLSGDITSSTPGTGSGSISVRPDMTVTVRGTMQALEHVENVSAAIDGRFGEVLVAPGHQVTAGTVIIRIMRPELQEQVDTNQELVKHLQTNLAALTASPPQPAKEAIDIAKAEFEKAQALAEFARLEATRFAKLRDTKVVSETEVANAHATLVAREADEKIAKARLDALVEQPSLHREWIGETTQRLEVAQQRLAQSRDLLEACTVRAPIDGVVLSLRAVPGQLAQPGPRPICQVADVHEIEIRAQVHPAEASQIDPGKDVDVQFDHQGTQVRWTGHIVSPDPEHVGNPVVVRVANPDWQLYRPGGDVTLRFQLRAAKAALNQGTDATPFANPGGLSATSYWTIGQANSAFAGLINGVVAQPVQMPVPTVLGPKAFRDGDVIEISEVQATSPKLEQGDSLTVRGRVRLASEEQAQLGLYLTQTEGDGREEVDLFQTIQVKRGRSQFELKTTIKHRGVLHITLYDPSGKPFGGVYFGTAPQMKQIESWSLDYFSLGKAPQKEPHPAEKEPSKIGGADAKEKAGEPQVSLVPDLHHLVRVHARLAGEVAEIGSLPNRAKGTLPDSESRPFRCGDRVRKGDLLAIVRGQDNVEKHSYKLDVRAPIDGTIVEKNCHVGDIVDPSFDLFKIAPLDNAPFPRAIDGTESGKP